MSGLVSRSQARSRASRLRNELMFQDTILTRNKIEPTETNAQADSSRYKSISTPGLGTMISLPGKAPAAVDLIHSTAAESPCTSTTFFAATFLM